MSDSIFIGKKPYIPFGPVNDEGHYGVIVHMDHRVRAPTNTELNTTHIKDAAANSFMEHFFPELYPFTNATSTTLIGELKSSMIQAATGTGAYSGKSRNIPGPPPKTQVLVIPDMDIWQKRNDLICATTLVPRLQWPGALEIFNSTEGIGAAQNSTLFAMSDLEAAKARLDGVLGGAQAETEANPQAFAYPANFNFLQGSVAMMLDLIMTNIGQTLVMANTLSPQTAGSMDDVRYFKIWFDNAPATHIAKIEYSTGTTNVGDWRPVKIGYFTLLKYSKLLRDPMTVRILKNFHEIGSHGTATTGFNQQSSIIDLVQNTFSGIPGGPPPGTPAFDPGVANKGGDKLAQARREIAFNCARPADVNDITKLKGTLASIMTPKEMRSLDQKVRNNPALLKQVYRDQRGKRLKAGVDSAKVIGNILSGDVSMGNEAIAELASRFGVDALAHEAMVCATFGTNVSLSRLSSAVQQIMSENYYAPAREPQKAEWPSDEKLSEWMRFYNEEEDEDGNKKPFSRLVQDVLAKAAAAMIMTLLTGLAEQLKAACEALRNPPRYLGQVNIADYVDLSTTTDGVTIPNVDIGSTVFPSGFFNTENVLEDLSEYLSNLSQILTPLDICRLVTAPYSVDTELLDRIIDFNADYEDTYGPSPVSTIVMTQLNTYSALVSFFSNLDVIVNVDEICEQYYNQNVVPQLNDICLTEGDIVDADTLDNILNLLENGPTVLTPQIDFLCPDRDEFMSNPFFTQTIPRAFKGMMENIETQFAFTLEGAKAAMLHQEQVASNDALEMLEAMNVNVNPEPASSVDPAVLTGLTDAMNGLATGIDMSGPFAQCLVDFTGNRSLQEATQIIDIAAQTLSNPAVQDQFTNLISEIGDLNNKMGAAGSPPPAGRLFTSFVFPPDYYDYMNAALCSQPVVAGQPGRVKFIGDVDPAGSAGTRTRKAEVSCGRFYGHSFVDNGIQTNGGYVHLKKRTSTADVLKIEFPKASAVGGYYARVKLVAPHNGEVSYTNLGLNPLHPSECTKISNVNPYAGSFTMHVYNNLRLSDYLGLNPDATGFNDDDDTALQTDLAAPLYQTAYGGLFEAAFKHVMQNGIFSVGAVNQLSFFKNNDLCDPANVGDLLDADGIIEQMKEEFLKCACQDGSLSPSEKVRQTLKYGIFLLLIQVTMIEFLVKNIFVLASFKFSDLLSLPGGKLSSMIRGYIQTKSDELLAQNPDLSIAKELARYFNVRIRRPLNQAAGGLFFPAATNGALAFPADKVFNANDYSDMMNFLMEERLNFVWFPPGTDTADPANERTTFKTIDNVMNSQTNPQSFKQVFYKNLIGFEDAYLGGLTTEKYNGQRVFLGIMSDKYRDYDNLKNLQYGKFVIQKHIEWDSVQVIQGGSTDFPQVELRNPVELWWDSVLSQGLFSDTEGSAFVDRYHDYGSVTVDLTKFNSLPVDVFMAVCREYHRQGPNGRDHADVIQGPNSQDRRLNFNGCRAVYKLVYYYPPSMLEDWRAANTGKFDDRKALFQRLFGGYEWSHRTMFQKAANRGFMNTPLVCVGVPSAGATPEEPSPPGTLVLLPVEVASFDAQYAGLNNVTIRSHRAFKGSLTSAYEGLLNQFNDLVLPSEIDRIADPYSPIDQFFKTSFDQESALMAPVMYSMHIADETFTELDAAFLPTKRAILGALNAAGGRDRSAAVPIRRTQVHGAPNDPAAGNGAMAQAFILKAMLNTPIDILKGLCEMIDPHWSTTKTIRDTTGMAFKAVGAVVDQALNDQRAAGTPIPGFVNSASILELIFCHLNNALNLAAAGTGADSSKAPGFFPRFTIEGVDFSASLLGVLMSTPGPLGIVLIVLEVLRNLPPPGNVPANQSQLTGPGITDMGIPASLPECDDGPQPDHPFWPEEANCGDNNT